MNKISWTTKAIKQMARIPAPNRKAISKAVGTELVDLSAARNVKKLNSHQSGYRLRVGNYRVFFDLDGAVCIVTVEEVKKRDEQTY